MSDDESVWPDHFPDGCPPADALVPNGKDVVYRFVHRNGPRDRDFVSAHDTGRRPSDPPCLCRGLSTFIGLDDARRAQRMVPGMKKKGLSGAVLDGSHGLLKRTLPRAGHHTWWVPTAVTPAPLFALVEGA